MRSYWTCETVFVETWSKWSVSKDNEKIWQILQIAGIVLFVLWYLQYLFTARKYQIDLQEQNNFNLQYNNEDLNLPEKSSSNKKQFIFFHSIPNHCPDFFWSHFTFKFLTLHSFLEIYWFMAVAGSLDKGVKLRYCYNVNITTSPLTN